MRIHFSDKDINDIIEKHFVSNRSIEDIHSEYGVAKSVIKRVIISQGRIPKNAKKWTHGVFVLKCAIALYNYGIGIRGLAERIDVPIMQLKSELQRQGIKLRNQSEQETMKWALMTKQQRLSQVEACHKATTGIKISHDVLVKQSKGRQRSVTHVSGYEATIADFFTKNGIAFEQQVSIDKYNADFIVKGVVVEIFGGKWHFYGHHAERFNDRIKKIFDCGYPVIILTISESYPLTDSVCDNLVGFINTVSINKPSIGKYWMVWGASDIVTTGGYDSIDSALIFPHTNVRNRVTGRYESVPK